MIVFGFVDAYSPQDDRRMVPVATNHAPNVIDGDVLPGLVPDVLPARDLFQDQKADFVAGVKEMARLRIMRSTGDVALELVPQD